METREAVEKLHEWKTRGWLNSWAFVSDQIVIEFNPGSAVNMQPWIQTGICDQLGDINDNRFAIPVYSVPGLFYSQDHFQTSVVADDFANDLWILFYTQNDYLHYDPKTEKTTLGPDGRDAGHLMKNVFYGLKFKEELLRTDREENLAFYNNTAQREFLILSPEHGIIEIGYPVRTIIFDETENIRENYISLASMNTADEFLIYLRQQIYKILFPVERYRRFEELVKNFSKIVDLAKSDYSIYLSKFSFETFNQNFRKEKKEYFASIREISNKILSYVASIPVSISATAYAVYQVQTVPTFAYTVVAAYLVYSILTAFFLRLIWMDTKELGDRLIEDVKIVNERVKIERELVNSEADKVKNKILRVQFLIYLVQGFLVLLSMVILSMALMFLGLDVPRFLLCVAALIFLYALINFWPIEKFSK
ncbi:MAG: hypothetical protein CVU39_23640 [Chloroflexi bacterium HGW-Chloroflexi-10]|nr:MAG: hypothetical protein CVU39_23640 [Chloroflexi bacterium HGW-Chloroflexi-10]